MTCIAAIVDNGIIYMGADSAGTSGYEQRLRRDEKIFINNDFIMGFTSSFRMGQLLRYSFKPPKFHADDKDIFAYMATDFVNEVRSCLKSGGYAQSDKGEETGGCFLVGHKGRLFEIEDDYQVAEVYESYMAIGSGQSYAIGAFAATEGEPVKTRLEKALKIAEKFNAGVSGPFNYLTLGEGVTL